MPKGELVLHPTLFNRLFPPPNDKPACPVCHQPIYVLTPIHGERLDNNTVLIIHADCANPPKAPDEPEAI